MNNEEVERHAPIAPSPLDAYRGSGRHAKKKATTPEFPETIVLEISEKPKEKKKPGRKKKEKPLVRFQIINEPVVLSFD